MSEPTDRQKTLLLAQLAAMEPDQWEAMVRWYVGKFVTDQQLLCRVLFEEALRRRQRQQSTRSADKVEELDALFLRLLKDLNLQIQLVV